MIHRTLLLVIALFPLSEMALALVRRSRGPSVQRLDQGSMRLLWLAIVLGLALAVAAQWIPSARLPESPTLIAVVALALVAGGLAVRWTAILTLGRLFTVDVAIQPDHIVIERGIYRFVRHPSYSGLLMAFVGLGVFFANWLSILGLLVPIILAVLHRVAREERALLEAMGHDYAAYFARTRRFIPWLI